MMRGRAGSTGRSGSRYGITLIETLVAIAVLLVIAAIVTPVYGTARKSAKIGATVSNLRQIYQAAMIYQADSGKPGAYGGLAESGLPGPKDFARGDLKKYVELFRSPCGIHPSSRVPTPYATVYFPGQFVAKPPLPDPYAPLAEEYQQNLIVAYDVSCSPANVDVENSLDEKFGLGALLSGTLVRKTRTGNHRHPSFWADAPD